jgi:hypothetical protein
LRIEAVSSFSPAIQITAVGARTAIMFDSAHENDLTRAARLIYVPQAVDSLSLRCDQPSQGISEVKLLVRLGDKVEEHDLATITMSSCNNMDVRKGVADHFQIALVRYLQSQNPAMVASEQLVVGAAPKMPVVSSHPQADRSAARRPILKSALVVGLVGLIGFTAVYAFSPRSVHSADPIQAAVVGNMAQDPASILAQVELTKETLRQMGLDPGRPGDLGCLAPQ